MALIGHVGLRAICSVMRLIMPGWPRSTYSRDILTVKGKSKQKCVETMRIMISEPIANDRAAEAPEQTTPPAP